MRPSEGVENHSSHELDRQSQPSRRGCQSPEVQEQPFTFCRLFGSASVFSTVFSMHSIGFLLRETEPELKLALNMFRTTICLSINQSSVCAK